MWKSWQTVLAAKVKINFCLLGFCYFFYPPPPLSYWTRLNWVMEYKLLQTLSRSLFVQNNYKIYPAVTVSLSLCSPASCQEPVGSFCWWWTVWRHLLPQSALFSNPNSQSDPLGEWKSPLSSSSSLSLALSSCSSCTTTATGWDPASVTSVSVVTGSATAPVTSISGSGGVREKECKLRQTYRQSVRQSQPVTAAQRKKFLIVFLTGHTTEDRHRQTDRQTIDRQFLSAKLQSWPASGTQVLPTFPHMAVTAIDSWQIYINTFSLEMSLSR